MGILLHVTPASAAPQPNYAVGTRGRKAENGAAGWRDGPAHGWCCAPKTTRARIVKNQFSFEEQG
jgi:hypothetical protein